MQASLRLLQIYQYLGLIANCIIEREMGKKMHLDFRVTTGHEYIVP